MGLLSGLMGNASQKNVDKVERDLEDILVPGEQVTLAFSLIRDLIVFTEFRLILVDKQGVTGKKTSYKSLPYRSISRFSVETSGHFDLDAELKIWVSSAVEPSEVLQFKSDSSVIEIQQALASAVLNKKYHFDREQLRKETECLSKKQLGQDRKWINIDSDMIAENSYLYKKIRD